MTPFIHAHSFEIPDFYKCSSADQSVPHKHILLTRSSLCCL